MSTIRSRISDLDATISLPGCSLYVFSDIILWVFVLVTILYLNDTLCLLDVKSMVSVGLTALASSSFDLLQAVLGKKSMNILCIGHGGGTIPLFLASKIKGEFFVFVILVMQKS